MDPTVALALKVSGGVLAGSSIGCVLVFGWDELQWRRLERRAKGSEDLAECISPSRSTSSP
jgi:hypothetical protein